jgi:type IV secretion system protein VirB3
MTPGYQIAVHNSLTTPILLAGAPRTFTILNGTCGAAITLGLHSWYALPIFFLAQGLMIYFTKQDPYFLQTTLRHIKQKDYYGV